MLLQLSLLLLSSGCWVLPPPCYPAMLPTPRWLRYNRLMLLLLSPGCLVLPPPCHPAKLPTPTWRRKNRLRLLLLLQNSLLSNYSLWNNWTSNPNFSFSNNPDVDKLFLSV